MGGLISSYYAANIAPHRVTDVITIGSPLNGTPVARIAIGPNARQMQRGTEFLKELKIKMKSREQIRFFHIASRCDQLVIPGDSAIIENNPHLIFDDLGHASMIFSKRVVKAIRNYLATEE
jgi:triacylglycerol lipase